MSRRSDGFTWVIAIMSSGWGEGPEPFIKMKRPKEVLPCLLRYLRTGQFSDDEKKLFLPHLDKWYRWWCRQEKINACPMPQSLMISPRVK